LVGHEAVILYPEQPNVGALMLFSSCLTVSWLCLRDR
jgi:hypothetical protein